MNAQGSEILDTQYFSALTDQVNACTSCAQLQALTTQSGQSVNAVKAALNAQIALLAPALALLSAPTDPTAVVTWVSNFITHVLTPLLLPSSNYALKLTALTAQIGALASAINSKAATIPGCSVAIP